MSNFVTLGYLIAAVCFILALRGLSSPATARQGNRIGIAGMVIAVVCTLFALPDPGWGSYVLIIVGMAIGGGIGILWRTPGRIPADRSSGTQRCYRLRPGRAFLAGCSR